MSQDTITPSVINLEDVNTNEYVIRHCQTKLSSKILNYTWSMTDFSIMCRSMQNLQAFDAGNQYFNISAFFDKQATTLYFCSMPESAEKEINVAYCIYVQTTKGKDMLLNKTNVSLTHNLIIYQISVKDLYEEKSIYLPNDTLTVCFQFEVVERMSYSYVTQVLIDEKESTRLNTGLNIKSDSLVTFVINEKEFLINKDLLCSKSDVFENMFNSKEKESENDVIEINDITCDVFKYLISFVETGSLDNLKMNADINYMETLYDFIIAANKYNITDLIHLCEQLLIKNTSKDNVVKHLNFALLNNVYLLEQYAIKFIKLYENIIAKTLEFKNLIKTFPHLLEQIMKVKLDGMTFVYE